ncbi:putative Leucine-rich repeat protein soc-2 like protein [Blattamonas nauphoetae]|uniref:Leucine-rich repeat protein soc-2 like protein n=1 Tax=Blattamonas nauphoetae TaxID=2049346 RepID=A0ABQ9X207_9EUKA|nr:putative Leucine-rich repeat protein soc-2 like protein [Blattamonas nauphoetae]
MFPSLEILLLTQNRIPRILSFHHSRLTVLDLSSNYLRSIDVPVHIPTLTVLGLGMNYLHKFSLPEGSSLPNLQFLDLRMNLLDKFDEDNPIDVIANNNRITSCPALLSSSTSPVKVNLSHNRLKQLPRISSDVSILLADSNFLGDIPEDTIPKQTKMTICSLSNNTLASLPPSFFSHHLTTLNLSHNAFDSIPEPVYHLHNLTILDLSFNRIKTISKTVSSLTRLTKLNLSFNKIETVPSSLFQLIQLKHLSLSHNLLRQLPTEQPFTTIADCIALLFVQNSHRLVPDHVLNSTHNLTPISPLEKLLLACNLFDSVPILVVRFNKLHTITLAGNSITALPPHFFTFLQHLSRVDLSFNQIEQLPQALFVPAKERASLNVSFNRLSSLPEFITSTNSALTPSNLEELSKDYFENVTEVRTTSPNVPDDVILALHVSLRRPYGHRTSLVAEGSHFQHVNVSFNRFCGVPLGNWMDVIKAEAMAEWARHRTIPFMFPVKHPTDFYSEPVLLPLLRNNPFYLAQAFLSSTQQLPIHVSAECLSASPVFHEPWFSLNPLDVFHTEFVRRLVKQHNPTAEPAITITELCHRLTVAESKRRLFHVANNIATFLQNESLPEHFQDEEMFNAVLFDPSYSFLNQAHYVGSFLGLAIGTASMRSVFEANLLYVETISQTEYVLDGCVNPFLPCEDYSRPVIQIDKRIHFDPVCADCFPDHRDAQLMRVTYPPEPNKETAQPAPKLEPTHRVRPNKPQPNTRSVFIADVIERLIAKSEETATQHLPTETQKPSFTQAQVVSGWDGTLSARIMDPRHLRPTPFAGPLPSRPTTPVSVEENGESISQAKLCIASRIKYSTSTMVQGKQRHINRSHKLFTFPNRLFVSCTIKQAQRHIMRAHRRVEEKLKSEEHNQTIAPPPEQTPTIPPRRIEATEDNGKKKRGLNLICSPLRMVPPASPISAVPQPLPPPNPSPFTNTLPSVLALPCEMTLRIFHVGWCDTIGTRDEMQDAVLIHPYGGFDMDELIRRKQFDTVTRLLNFPNELRFTPHGFDALVEIEADLSKEITTTEEARVFRQAMFERPWGGVYGLFDGHTGRSTAMFLKHHFVSAMQTVIQDSLNEEMSNPFIQQATSPMSAADEKMPALNVLEHTLQLLSTRISRFGVKDGSCALTALLTPSHIHIGNVGDSRAVLFSTLRRRKPFPDSRTPFHRHPPTDDIASDTPPVLSAFVARSLTIDHKPTNYAEREYLRSVGATVSLERRIEGVLAVGRAFGDLDMSPSVSSEPDFFSVPITTSVEMALPGDLLTPAQLAALPSVEAFCRPQWPHRGYFHFPPNDFPPHEALPSDWTCLDQVLVLACDGVFDVLSNDQIAAVLHPLFSLVGANKGLFAEKAALAIRTAAEASDTTDNVSVIVVCL